jgi:signal transduction histidine kinase/CheY-like chemotaxis protein
MDQLPLHIPSSSPQDSRVVAAYEDSVITTMLQVNRGFYFFFFPLALACMVEVYQSLGVLMSTAWLCVFLTFQVARLCVHRQTLLRLKIRTRMLLGAVGNAAPFGILALISFDRLDNIQYMVLTLMLVFVTVAVIAACPSFADLHKAYIWPLLGCTTLGWLLSQYQANVTMAAMLIILIATLELASRYLRQTGLRRTQLEVANQKLARDLQEKVQSLEQLNRSKTSLLAAACHDLRQPTHATGLLIEAILSGANTGDADCQQRLLLLQRSNITASNMLSALMDLARLDTGSLQASRLEIDLNELLDESRGQFAIVALQKGLRLKIPRTDLRVFSDPYLLRRVVFNLLSNAIKYTHHGEVSITLYRARGRVQLSVSDTGIGIAESEKEKVFEEYTQLAKGSEGLGIGLSIVQRACALMQHRLTLDSTLGTGTRFTIEMELASEPAVQPAEVEPFSSLPQLSRSLHPSRMIAVVEDDVTIRQAAIDLLTQWNYVVIDAADPHQIVQLIESSSMRPSLVISDLHLRKEDGFSVIHRIRALAGLEGLPAILVTGDLNPEYQQLADRYSIKLLHKPVPPRQLRGAIQKALDQEA